MSGTSAGRAPSQPQTQAASVQGGGRAQASAVPWVHSSWDPQPRSDPPCSQHPQPRAPGAPAAPGVLRQTPRLEDTHGAQLCVCCPCTPVLMLTSPMDMKGPKASSYCSSGAFTALRPPQPPGHPTMPISPKLVWPLTCDTIPTSAPPLPLVLGGLYLPAALLLALSKPTLQPQDWP